MKREITALAAFCVCGLLGCATHPSKIEYADGPGPHAFDCEAGPIYYQDFNIHAPPLDRRARAEVIDLLSVGRRGRWLAVLGVIFEGQHYDQSNQGEYGPHGPKPLPPLGLEEP